MGSANLWILMITTFLAGFGVVGAQIGMNALAAGLYPTAIRSTGVGWALGVGRIGSIIGPLAGGVLLGFGWNSQSVVLVAGIPALLAGMAVIVLRGRGRTSPSCRRPQRSITNRSKPNHREESCPTTTSSLDRRHAGTPGFYEKIDKKSHGSLAVVGDLVTPEPSACRPRLALRRHPPHTCWRPEI
jgi:MFS family permease